MMRRVVGYGAIGCLVGAACGWWFGQVPVEAGLGLAAGVLLAVTRVGASARGARAADPAERD